MALIHEAHLAIGQLEAKSVHEEEENFVFGIVDCWRSNVAFNAADRFDLACSTILAASFALRERSEIPVGVPSWVTPTSL